MDIEIHLKVMELIHPAAGVVEVKHCYEISALLEDRFSLLRTNQTILDSSPRACRYLQEMVLVIRKEESIEIFVEICYNNINIMPLDMRSHAFFRALQNEQRS